MAGRTVLQMDQAAPPHQGLLRHQRERRQDPNLDRHLSLCPRRHRPKTTEDRIHALPNPTDPERYPLRENAHFTGSSGT